MFRRLLLLLIFASVASACAVASESGDAPEPVLSGVPATTEAGVAALSNASIDPNTCAGVLGNATGTHSRQTRSLTSTVQSSGQQIEAMCTASYETQFPGDPFLTATLIKFESDEGVHIQFVNKTPGSGNNLTTESLNFHFPSGVIRDAYERLLLDAIEGDATHFNRDDEIEFSWKIIDPFIESWIKRNQPTLHKYEVGSFGPPAAEKLLGPGRHWVLTDDL